MKCLVTAKTAFLFALIFIPLVIIMMMKNPQLDPLSPRSASEVKDATEDTTATEGTELLSIHMIIMPFLQYDASEEEILERENDYKHVLVKNLAHPLVERVHLLTTNYNNTFERFREFSALSDKLTVSEVKSIDRARDPWDYVAENLLGKDVMFANADIYLGEGFEKVDAVAMRRQKIMYSISRHVAPEGALCGKKKKRFFFQDKCNFKKYTGSHDVFLFRIQKPFPDEFYEKLQFNLVKYGMESRVMWLFHNVLNYCVLNPCSVLKIYHYHCSDLRNNVKMKRLEESHFYKCLPSDQLLCNTSI